MKRFALTALPAALLLTTAFSAHALTPGSGTWAKETAIYGPPNLKEAYVYVPKNASPAVKNGKRALMLTLHGCYQNASGHVINNKYNWDTTAEQYGMVVVAPTVPSDLMSSTRKVGGCWDWFGSGHSRSTRDEGSLLKLIDSIKARAELDIDPKQIYVTGLSSGGAVAADLLCVAPDYFAGGGLAAAPVFNTPAGDGVGSVNVQTPAQIAQNCRTAAGKYASALDTQITSVVNGTLDPYVHPSHDQGNEDGMRTLYGANTSAGTFTETNSTGRLWKDANGKVRVSRVEATGMLHAWPAGAGGSGGGKYVDYRHVNYPAYVTKFFFDNNLRAGGGSGTTTTTSGEGTTTTTTTTTAPPSGKACFNDTNAAHVQAGRAINWFGFNYAKGSFMFLGGTSVKTKLRMMAPNYYIIDITCP